MAKPFVPPTQKEVLRFRYTTYMGEEHPAEKKVVVEFCPADMPDLTEIQRLKLKKLVGVRYNPETDIVKMSCEMFETQPQNKRYLGDLVDTLLREARVSSACDCLPRHLYLTTRRIPQTHSKTSHSTCDTILSK
jgi:small subunit ribosomal protein S35